MSLHEHCIKCFDANCNKDGSFVGFGDDSCPIAECSNNCGATLHECKLADHELICPNSVVPCVNSLNGCPKTLPRYKMCSHISRCPASVVICSEEWNRWQRTPVNDDNEVYSTATDENCEVEILDVALAASDQKRLEEALKMPKSLRRALRNPLTSNIPAVPFVQRNVQDSNTSVEDNINPLNATSSDTEDDDDDEECNHCPPGHANRYDQVVDCSLCRARAETKGHGLSKSIHDGLLKIAESNNCKGSEQSSPNEKGGSKKSRKKSQTISNPQVNLEVEMLNSFRSKPSKMFTFLCAKDFRRDQYAQHYKTVHCEIQSSLDRWYQVRCPLSVYGCPYTMQRFIPVGNKKIIYSIINESFTSKFLNDSVSCSDAQVDWFARLPNEVLILILSCLDSQSLKSISLVSKRMRGVTSHLLTEKGIVILDWKKENNRWQVHQKVWSFSTAFDKIDGWKFADVGAVVNHLSMCPYFTTEIKSEPFMYHPQINGTSSQQA